MNLKLALGTLSLLSLNAFANESITEKPPEFTLSAELGFLYKTGNTKSADFKAGFNIRHEKNQWLNLINVNLLAKKIETEDANGDDKFNTTDNKWNIVTQTNYTISPHGKNYIYANVSYEEDRFSSYEKQSSISAGWGRHWYETKTSSLFADIGPGFKHDVIKATDTQTRESNSTLIMQAQALYLHQLNEFVEFKQLFVAKYATKSNENSIFKAESSITTKLIESLQMKFSLLIDHNTEAKAPFVKTDTQTSVTLVYSF